jgi:hypothetical protein
MCSPFRLVPGEHDFVTCTGVFVHIISLVYLISLDSVR